MCYDINKDIDWNANNVILVNHVDTTLALLGTTQAAQTVDDIMI